MAKELSLEQLKKIRSIELKKLAKAIGNMEKPGPLTERQKVIIDIKRLREARRKRNLERLNKVLGSIRKGGKKVLTAVDKFYGIKR